MAPLPREVVSGEGVQVYTRDPWSRFVSVSVLLVSVALLGYYLCFERRTVPRLTLFLLVFFALAGTYLTVGNFWDRVLLGGEGIEIRNLVWERLGWVPRRATWEEIESLREHRSRALFIRRAGSRRPIVLDALSGYADAVRTVQERTGISLPPRRDEIAGP